MLSSDCTVTSAKVCVMQKMKLVFKFAQEVLGKDDLTTLARPYVNMAVAAELPNLPAAKI